MMRLGDICAISSGYTARGKLRAVDDDGIPTIQLRDVEGGGRPVETAPLRCDLSNVSERYLVRGGEVLFRSRGDTNTAASVMRLAEPAVVILPLVIIRPDDDLLIPEYLAWIINQPNAQQQIAAAAQGTNIRMVPLPVVERLEISVPDIPTQRRIAELSILALHEGHLLRQLASRREQLVNAILGEAAKAADQKEIS